MFRCKYLNLIAWLFSWNDEYEVSFPNFKLQEIYPECFAKSSICLTEVREVKNRKVQNKEKNSKKRKCASENQLKILYNVALSSVFRMPISNGNRERRLFPANKFRLELELADQSHRRLLKSRGMFLILMQVIFHITKYFTDKNHPSKVHKSEVSLQFYGNEDLPPLLIT